MHDDIESASIRELAVAFTDVILESLWGKSLLSDYAKNYIIVKTVHACPSLTSKLSAEVWKTRYECSLSPGNENSKLEMETPK